MESPDTAFEVVEYRTFDEGLCDANYFLLPKNSVKGIDEAFVKLINYQIHFYEEWEINEKNPSCVDDIVNKWLIPELERYEFIPVTADKINKETDLLAKSIRDKIEEVSGTPMELENPLRWGIYLNSKKCSNCEIDAVRKRLTNGIVSGVQLRMAWNEIEFFYETKNDYILFSWSTGA